MRRREARTTADNYVALRLKATDDAKPDLEDLKLRLDELKGKVAEARAKVDTTEADLPLARLAAKLEAVGKQIARPRVDMAGAARAVVELEAVDVAMKRTSRAAEFMAARTKVAGLSAAKGIGVFSLAAAGLGAAGPLGAAGLAVAAFGAVAVPILHKVAAAHKALLAAQQQYNKAVTSKQRESALKAEAAATAGLTSQQKGLMGQVSALGKAWNGIEAALTPIVVDVAKVAISVAQDLMPAFKSLAETGGNALETILGYLGQFLRTPFFGRFIAEMTKLANEVAPLLGQSLVGVLKVFMQLFMQAGPAGIQILNVLLPLIVQLAGDLVPVITVIAKVIAVVLEWLQQTHLLIPLLAVLAVAILAIDAPITAIIIAIALLVAAGVELARHWGEIWHAIAHYFDDARHFIAHVFDDIIHYAEIPLDWIRSHWPLILGILTGPVGIAVYEIVSHWNTIKSDAMRIIGGIIGWVKENWHKIIAWLADPIGMAVYEIRTHTHQIAKAFDQLRHMAAAILAGMRHDIARWVDIVRHDTAALAEAVPRLIARGFDIARHAAASAADRARHLIAVAWDAIRHETASMIDRVASFFRALPGRILSFLGSLPGRMLKMGRNIIDGLIHGITSAASDIPGIMKGLASDVASYFTDPLKIFSPSRVFFEHGRNIVRGAVLGVQAEAPELRQVMGRVAQSVAGARPAFGGSGAHAGGHAQMELVLRFERTGDPLIDAILHGLRGEVRKLGGDPMMFQRKVAFRT